MIETLLKRIHDGKLIEKTYQWLITQQNVIDGGFPPYPTYINESGIIATADFVGLLFRPPSIYNFINLEDDNALDKAVRFLLNTQISDGGFPPGGDIFNILDVSFIESTADSVIALLTYLRLNQNKHTEIELPILRGINYLLKTKRTTKSLPIIWPSYDKSDEGNFRLFPTIMALVALELFADISDEQLFSMTIGNTFIKKIKETISSGITLLVSFLKERRSLPFSISDEVLSITNTTNAVGFLISVRRYQKKIYAEKKHDIELSISNGIKTILDNVSSLLSQKIDVMDEEKVLLNIPGKPKEYTTTFRREVVISYLLSHIIATGEEIENIKKSNIEECLYNLLSRLLNLITSNKNFLEERRVGEFVPATSATSLFLSTIKNSIAGGCREYSSNTKI